MFNKTKLSQLISLTLLGAVISAPALALDEDKTSDEKIQQFSKQAKSSDKNSEKDNDDAQQKAPERIVITGSFIPREEYDGSQPMTIIDEEEMKAKGLQTVAEVIESLAENSGYSEGDSGNLLSGFTVGAQEANFRGLGTGRTLILINGRRIADYPLPFGGEQNGVDLGTIPSSAVARVEYLSSGASAIYGSDAVGGVVNIITKRDMEQSAISGYLIQPVDGYGTQGKLSYVTGSAYNKGSFTIGVEAMAGSMINAKEVEFLDDVRYVTSAIQVARYDAGVQNDNPYVSPMGYECDESRGLEALEGYDVDGKTVCNYDASEQIALSSDFAKASLFFDARYDITNEVMAFATVMATTQEVKSKSPSFGWNGGIYSERNQNLYIANRSFGSDFGAAEAKIDSTMWTATFGLEGSFDALDTTWYWDVSSSLSKFDLTQDYEAMDEKAVEDWIFEGIEYSETTPISSTFNIDNDDFDVAMLNNLFRDASDARDQLVGNSVTEAGSEAAAFQAKIVGSLSDFDVLYNPIEMAVVFDYNTGDTEIHPDQKSLDFSGNGWMNIGAINATGSRDRYAAGIEFRVPATEKLDVTFATRYDHYDDDSSIGGRQTSQLKFLYRATEALKIRGGTSQSFRAPDMFNIYGESTGFTTAVDFITGGCFNGEEFTGTCTQSLVSSTRSGSSELEEEKGTEKSLGIIFTPMSNYQMSIDWWQVNIKDMVATESAYDLFVGEWQCATGARDENSRYCEDINERVVRDPNTNQIDQIIISPQNQSFVEVEGLDIRLNGKWESEDYGVFTLGLNHSATLKYDWQKFAGDEVFDLVGGSTGSATPKNITTFNLGHRNSLTGFKSYGANLFVRRMSALDNYVDYKELEPYYTVTVSGYYRFSAKFGLQLTLENLTNEMPNEDVTNQRWPYFYSYLQTPYGRSVALSFSYNL